MSITAKPPCDEAIIESQPCVAPCKPQHENWILAATILGSSLAFIDGTVVNVALPVLQTELQATVVDAQWFIEAYALFLAALILAGGALGDLYGRKRIFALGVVIFALASIGCALAQNSLQLIMIRAIQGIGAALLVPGSLAIISASFSSEGRGRAIGIWSSFTSITSAIGPVLGGWLIQYSWRWIFWINIPIAIVVLYLLFRYVPESRSEGEQTRQLDWGGTILVTLGLGTLVYGLTEVGQTGWTNPINLIFIGVGALSMVAFVFFEARTPTPMLPLTLFNSRNFSGANLLTLFLYAALGGAFFFVPFNLIQVQNYSTTAAGAAMLPMILIMFLLSRWSGGLVDRYGPRLPLIVGPIIVALGYWLFSLPGIGGSYWTTYFPAIVVLGLGMAISVAPLTTTVMGSVSTQHTGVASGVNNAVSRVAQLLAIAVLGIVVTTTFSNSLHTQLNQEQIAAPVQQQIEAQTNKLVNIDIPPGQDEPLLRQNINNAFIDGFRALMYVSVALALASALSTFLMIQNPKNRKSNIKEKL